MQYTFGVIIPGSIITALLGKAAPTVRMCGSLPELGAGSVERAPCLTLRNKEFYAPIDLINEPRFYRLDIQLPADLQEFSYKYYINEHYGEGHENELRQWKRDEEKRLVDQVCYTPIDYWIDIKSSRSIDSSLFSSMENLSLLESNERLHTTRFYDEVVAHQLIHYGCVNDQLYVGSCPRILSHITDELKVKLGITAVINMQVLNDIERNCVAIVGEEKIKKDRNDTDLEVVEALRTAYEQADILFMWLPTTDFSTTGRELMSPQAALVLKTMLEKGHRVYVHCNAGESNLRSVRQRRRRRRKRMF